MPTPDRLLPCRRRTTLARAVAMAAFLLGPGGSPIAANAQQRTMSKNTLPGKLKLVLAAFAASATLSAEAAPTLYGVTFSSQQLTNQLITIDTTDGGVTVVGNLSSNMGAMGLAVKDGKLYTFDQFADRLVELNPATGATVTTIDLNFDVISNVSGEGGIDFRSDGVGFMASSSGAASILYSFTTSAGSGGSGSYIGSNDTAGIDGLAFDSANMLYGLGQTPNYNLYTVDQTTGALTLIGATGVDATASDNLIGGLDFLGSTLYAVINDSLYTLDTGTGEASFIGRSNVGLISGIAFLDVADDVDGTAPEPATLALLGLGLAGLAAARRRSQ